MTKTNDQHAAVRWTTNWIFKLFIDFAWKCMLFKTLSVLSQKTFRTVFKKKKWTSRFQQPHFNWFQSIYCKVDDLHALDNNDDDDDDDNNNKIDHRVVFLNQALFMQTDLSTTLSLSLSLSLSKKNKFSMAGRSMLSVCNSTLQHWLRLYAASPSGKPLSLSLHPGSLFFF